MREHGMTDAAKSDVGEMGEHVGHDQQKSAAIATDKNEEFENTSNGFSKELGFNVNGDVEKGDLTDSEPSTSPIHDSAAGETKTEPADATSSVQDPNIVDWEPSADKDPANPLNWSEKLKWGNIGILAMLSLLTYVATSRCFATKESSLNIH
jgi:hypothetical protein